MAELITASDLQQLMASNELHAVIDVRPTEDFRAGQIFGSTSVPALELAERLPRLIPVSSVLTAAIAEDAASSSGAATQFEQLGLTRVRWLEGGYAGWVEMELPTIFRLECAREGLQRAPADPGGSPRDRGGRAGRAPQRN